MQKFLLREKRVYGCTDVCSKRLMITRLENIQVGKSQYLYKTGRHIWSTKNMELMNGLGVSGHVYRLIKGEQNEKDNERVIKCDHRLKRT